LRELTVRLVLLALRQLEDFCIFVLRGGALRAGVVKRGRELCGPGYLSQIKLGWLTHDVRGTSEITIPNSHLFPIASIFLVTCVDCYAKGLLGNELRGTAALAKNVLVLDFWKALEVLVSKSYHTRSIGRQRIFVGLSRLDT